MKKVRKALHFDAGKPDLSQIPLPALESAAYVFMFGARKYGKDNYRAGMDHRQLIASTLRHVNKWNWGEDSDKESGISHLAHALVDLMILITNIAEKKGSDDRFIKKEQGV
jgi:hypothetical protein